MHLITADMSSTESSVTSQSAATRNAQTTAARDTVGSKVKMAGRARRFDVFLSYAEEDEEFAEEVRTRLVQENLRVFIPSQGKGW